MVYIEQQSNYLSQLKQSPLAPLLNELLNSEVQAFSPDTHNASEVALNLLICVKTANSFQAEQIYSQFSKRQPNRDSHWIYDNFVVFAIVSAVRKFNLAPQWTKDVIDLAYSSSSNLDKGIKDIFKNILAGNFNIKSEFYQIVVVYQFLAKDENFELDLINKMYSLMWASKFPFFDDDFLNVLSLKAIEIAFLKKCMLSPQEQFQMDYFVPKYIKRVDIIAGVIAWLIVFLTIDAIFYGLWKVNQNEKNYPVFAKTLFFIIGISGIGVTVIWGWKKGLTKFIKKGINNLFGYRSVLPINDFNI